MNLIYLCICFLKGIYALNYISLATEKIFTGTNYEIYS